MLLLRVCSVRVGALLKQGESVQKQGIPHLRPSERSYSEMSALPAVLYPSTICLCVCVSVHVSEECHGYNIPLYVCVRA